MGHYNFSADSGTYRIDVVRTGYQPYRSANINAEQAERKSAHYARPRSPTQRPTRSTHRQRALSQAPSR
ncbi:MAG: hypothetical protein R2867_44160 [Caldilineaceae bacterium]